MSDLKLLTLREVAQVLKVSPRTVWAMVDSGKLPHVRIGNGRGKFLSLSLF